MMQRELPKIDFTSLSEVRSNAEYRRTEEISGLLKVFFDRWMPKFHRKRPIFKAVQYAAAGNHGLPSRQS